VISWPARGGQTDHRLRDRLIRLPATRLAVPARYFPATAGPVIYDGYGTCPREVSAAATLSRSEEVVLLDKVETPLWVNRPIIAPAP
jgi:hypothetical protein